MSKQEKEPFLPFVTVDDIVKFDPQRPETYTESKLINAILQAIDKVGAADTKRIASYMAMEERLLSYGVRIACGMNLTGLRSVVTIKTAAQMYAEDPKNSMEDVAIRLGYGNRSSIWVIINNKKYADIVQRLCPDLLKPKQQQ